MIPFGKIQIAGHDAHSAFIAFGDQVVQILVLRRPQRLQAEIVDDESYRTGPNSWMEVHGSGAGHETLARQVVGRNVALIADDDLHNLSLQGPVAVDFLAQHLPGIRSAAVHGTPLTIAGKTVAGPANAHTLPFDDPKKSKRNAVA